jgi:hypothetical protein
MSALPPKADKLRSQHRRPLSANADIRGEKILSVCQCAIALRGATRRGCNSQLYLVMTTSRYLLGTTSVSHYESN